MSIIRVPLNVRSLTLIINGNRAPSIWTRTFFDCVFNVTKSLWLGAQIQFDIASFTSNVEIELLNQNSANRLNQADQEYIGSCFRATTGASILLVNEAASRDAAAAGVGGSAMAAYRACLLAHSSNQRTVGLYLAHELGHLLGLHDIYTGLGDNLMYGALGTGDGRLTHEQRRTASRGAQLLNQPSAASSH